jgi:hypothetical protein
MNLDLTIDQINVIMQALGNAPYIQVAEIQKQAVPQVNPAPEPK